MLQKLDVFSRDLPKKRKMSQNKIEAALWSRAKEAMVNAQIEIEFATDHKGSTASDVSPYYVTRWERAATDLKGISSAYDLACNFNRILLKSEQ